MPILTPKQQRFVENYLLDLNATQAAIRAGYSERTANQQGPRLLGNADVRKAIDAAKIKRSDKLEIDADWVLTRLADEADADLAELYDDDNNLKPVSEWPLIWRQGLVAGVEIEALFEGRGDERIQIGYTKRLRLSDRVRRLELIGKHIRVNAFQETVQHKGLDTLAERLERASNRDPAPFARKPTQAAAKETAAPMQQASRSSPPPAAAPQPKPYRPIKPVSGPAPWPTYSGAANTDPYDLFES